MNKSFLLTHLVDTKDNRPWKLTINDTVLELWAGTKLIKNIDVTTQSHRLDLGERELSIDKLRFAVEPEMLELLREVVEYSTAQSPPDVRVLLRTEPGERVQHSRATRVTRYTRRRDPRQRSMRLTKGVGIAMVCIPLLSVAALISLRVVTEKWFQACLSADSFVSFDGASRFIPSFGMLNSGVIASHLASADAREPKSRRICFVGTRKVVPVELSRKWRKL